MAKKIILDCDPGHDDAVAILLALGNPEIELVGVTTVGGNQSLEKVTYNARAVLEAGARSPTWPCTPDATARIVRAQEVAASIHGESRAGRRRAARAYPPARADMHAVNFIVEDHHGRLSRARSHGSPPGR